MGEVLISLWTLLVLIAAGYVLARLKVAPPGSDTAITKVCFALPMPAMIFLAVYRADISHVFSKGLAVNVISASILFAFTYFLAVKFFHLSKGRQTVAALCASYTNAGNIGIPYLVAITGDPTLSAAIMLFQLSVLMPLSFFLLGIQTSEGTGAAREESAGKNRARFLSHLAAGFAPVLRQPPLYGLLLGLVWSVFSLPLAPFLGAPMEALSTAVVPMLMMAVGINASRSTLRELRDGVIPLVTTVSFRIILSPLLTFALALVLGVEGKMLLASMVAATFPVANNVFIFSMKFGTGQELARNAMVTSTLLSFPAVTLVALLFS